MIRELITATAQQIAKWDIEYIASFYEANKHDATWRKTIEIALKIQDQSYGIQLKTPELTGA